MFQIESRSVWLVLISLCVCVCVCVDSNVNAYWTMPTDAEIHIHGDCDAQYEMRTSQFGLKRGSVGIQLQLIATH